MKIYKLLTICMLLLALLSISSLAVEISTYVVDGVYNNQEVVIYNHDPIFSWEYDLSISSFNLNVLRNSTTVWFIAESTNSLNTRDLGITKGYRSFTSISSTNLITGITYGWNIIIYRTSSSDTKEGHFFTVVSSISLPGTKSDLQVDFNNPFNPYGGQKTKFRYVVGSNSKVKVRVYTITGEYVNTVADHSAYKDMIYTAEWDGLDYSGNPVPSGIYLVNLDDDGSKGITRKVIVINK